MRDTALVVPSIRKDSFERFITEWRPTGLFERVDLILVEDNPERSFETFPEVQAHYSWATIDTHPWSSIIPRRSDTVRSFGYWAAWKQGYEYLMTLDDDCYPAAGHEALDAIHRQLLTRTKWYSTLNNVRPRGVPYQNLGSRPVYVNHGIWKGVLDYDAPQQLVDPVPEVYTNDNRFVPHGSYFPFCGMNWMCRREAIPLMYHLLMGQAVSLYESSPQFMQVNGVRQPLLERLPFDRFGDIWCGIIMKKICDHLGWAISTGTPYIHHDRASNPFTNLRKEANGIEMNERFWELIDAAPLQDLQCEFPGEEAAICYRSIGDWISDWEGEHRQYWRRLGRAMVTWAELFLD